MKIFTTPASLFLVLSSLVLFSACWEKSDIVNPPLKDSPYVGTRICGSCHEKIYTDYLTSGHSQQFQLVTYDQAPKYYWENAIPFPIESPPRPLAWDDIYLVLGGHYGFGVFFDQSGNLITGPESFWNIQTGSWATYDPGQTAPYDCARCHTSGYDPKGTQVEFPSLQGSWEQDGVTCEGCHGPGWIHIKTRRPEDILVDTSEGFCLRCHGGNEGHPIPGFGDVDLGNSHGGSCSMCHNPHVSFKYEFELSIWRDCADCHTSDGKTESMRESNRDGKCDR